MAMEACSDDLPIDDNCGSSSDAKDDNDDDAVSTMSCDLPSYIEIDNNTTNIACMYEPDVIASFPRQQEHVTSFNGLYSVTNDADTLISSVTGSTMRTEHPANDMEDTKERYRRQIAARMYQDETHDNHSRQPSFQSVVRDVSGSANPQSSSKASKTTDIRPSGSSVPCLVRSNSDSSLANLTLIGGLAKRFGDHKYIEHLDGAASHQKPDLLGSLDAESPLPMAQPVDEAHIEYSGGCDQVIKSNNVSPVILEATIVSSINPVVASPSPSFSQPSLKPETSSMSNASNDMNKRKDRTKLYVIFASLLFLSTLGVGVRLLFLQPAPASSVDRSLPPNSDDLAFDDGMTAVSVGNTVKIEPESILDHESVEWVQLGGDITSLIRQEDDTSHFGKSIAA